MSYSLLNFRIYLWTFTQPFYRILSTALFIRNKTAPLFLSRERTVQPYPGEHKRSRWNNSQHAGPFKLVCLCYKFISKRLMASWKGHAVVKMGVQAWSSEGGIGPLPVLKFDIFLFCRITFSVFLLVSQLVKWHLTAVHPPGEIKIRPTGLRLLRLQSMPSVWLHRSFAT